MRVLPGSCGHDWDKKLMDPIQYRDGPGKWIRMICVKCGLVVNRTTYREHERVVHSGWGGKGNDRAACYEAVRLIHGRR